jgi:hypothetical protein
MLDEYKVNVPEGQSGEWCVEHCTVTPEGEAFERLRAMINSHRVQRFVPAGDYTRLTRNGTVIMSDTPDEIRDHLAFIERAQGHILIAGLGLGVVLQALLCKKDVQTVTVIVIEKSPDVIKLVWPSFAADRRAAVICADIFAWKPPGRGRYDWAWFDIWDQICADNLPEMTRLHRRFGRRAAVCASWCHSICKRHQDGRQASMRRNFAAVGGDPMRELSGDSDEPG